MFSGGGVGSGVGGGCSVGGCSVGGGFSVVWGEGSKGTSGRGV